MNRPLPDPSAAPDLREGGPPAEWDHLGLSERGAERWLWRLVALGIGLRALVYLLRFPIWTDEAKLATSLLDRSYAGLLEPLAYAQIAPFPFLWIQETATLVFGFSEFSLRLVPALAAVAGVLLMRHLTRRIFRGAPALFAMALFAVSYYPIRHGAELKPYATDLLASLVLTALAVEALREPARSRWLWLWAGAAPLAVAVSYPAIFTAAGILAALAIPVWRQRGRRHRWAFAAGGLLAAAAFALSFFVTASSQYHVRSVKQMRWDHAFPPLDDPLGALGWLVHAHTGRTFGYPLGGENGGSLLTFAAFVVGAVTLARAGRRRLLAVLALPFGAGLCAAVLQRYPYGGSGRVSQYMVPAICLLAGLGLARISSLARRPGSRRRAQKGVLVFLVLFGLLLGAAAILRPYRDHADSVGRDFARWFWDVQSRDAELVSAWEDLRLDFARPPDRWAPGGAGFRVNRQIYSRRVRRGLAPDLDRVSPERPLRIVFQGSAISPRRPDLWDWVREMETRYLLVDQERYRLGPFAEQHGREDWIEVFTFVPRSAAPPAPARP